MTRNLLSVAILTIAAITSRPAAQSQPVYAQHGVVASANMIASEIGRDVLAEGGNAVDAAVATAFALAVVHPSAGNIGGGGFLVFRGSNGETAAYDFREKAPASATPEMWLDENGQYSSRKHHSSHLAVGVPGTVAGLHLAWQQQGSLPWIRLVEPAIELAEEGFPLSVSLARSIGFALRKMQPYPAAVAQFSNNGVPYEAGDVFRQPDLARSLRLIAERGPDGFYKGEIPRLIAQDMAANRGALTEQDFADYRAVRREVVKGTYRGHEIIGMPPPSSGGIAVIEMLNILEPFDLAGNGFGSAANVHLMTEAMRRAFRDRAMHVGDPDFNPDMPVERLISKSHAAQLRNTIDRDVATASSLVGFEWLAESDETTHISVVDRDRGAVSLTYTLEAGYGSGIVSPGTGFLLNNELGDFNAAPGLTNDRGLIGTAPNLAQPGKRPLSSMSPTIVAKDGELLMVTGSPGGRTIINTVLQTIINVIDHGMNAQEANDAGRIHHQWMPDVISYEPTAAPPDARRILEQMGHTLRPRSSQGAAQVIVVEGDLLEAGPDRRRADGGAAGY
ncbi:MAG: gamma-glutamyltransferase [Planctomycetota bacterium]